MKMRHLAIVLSLLIASAASAELKLPALLSDHAVVQANKEIAVWGTADAGAAVEVKIGTSAASAKADGKGKWSVKLPPLPPSATPLEMTISAGTDKKVVRDILVGEVWLGSGQSDRKSVV